MSPSLLGTALLLFAVSGPSGAQLVPRLDEATSGPNPVGPPQPWSRTARPAPRILELPDSSGWDIAVAPDGDVHVVGGDSSETTPREWILSMPDPADPGQDVLLVEDKSGPGLLLAVDSNALVIAGNVGAAADFDGAYYLPGDPLPHVIPDLAPASTSVTGTTLGPTGVSVTGLESGLPILFDESGGTRFLLGPTGSLVPGVPGRMSKDGSTIPGSLTDGRAVLWVDEIATALDDPTGVGSVAVSISPNGLDVCGKSVDATGLAQPALWRDVTGHQREVLLDDNGAPFFFGGELRDIEDDGFSLVNAFYLTGDQVGVWHPSFGSLNTRPLSTFLAERGVPVAGEVFTGGIAAAWDGESYHLLLAEQGGNEYYVSCADLD